MQKPINRESTSGSVELNKVREETVEEEEDEEEPDHGQHFGLVEKKIIPAAPKPPQAPIIERYCKE
jgi:hypothetical protein